MVTKSQSSAKGSSRNGQARKGPEAKGFGGKGRASWSGLLKFGLVSFPVEAFNVLKREQGTIALHQLHAACHSRIRYEKHCPIHGKVPNDEIVSGYEYGKDQYIEITPEELDSLYTDADRALTIDTFIEPDDIDPIYYDGRMYYLMPKGKASEESYAMFQEAMQHQGRYGVGQVVFSGKAQLVLLRALDGLLQMAMLNYEAEIRKPAEMNLVKPRLTPKKVDLAETLIKTWGDAKFDLSKYKDGYRDRVAAMVKAKIEGKEVVAPEAGEEPDVINLMDALRKSVEVAALREEEIEARGGAQTCLVRN